MDVIKSNYGTVSSEEIDALYSSILKNNIDQLVEQIKEIKETGIDIKILIDKILDNFIDKAVNMKKEMLAIMLLNN